MIRKLVAPVLLAVASYQPALAETSISFGTDDVRFSVIDLTPTDGIAAGFTVGATATSLAILANGSNTARELPGGQAGSIAATSGPLRFTAGTSGLTGATRIDLYQSDAAFPAGLYSVIAEQDFSLTLHANSLLLVDGASFRTIGSWTSDGGIISTMAVTLQEGPGGPAASYRRSDLLPSGANGVRSFQIAFANTGAADMALHLNVASRLQARPIPEPASYAMLAAGCTVLAAAIRRRNRAA